MAETPVPPLPTWFADYQDTTIGHTYIGERSRTHIVDLIAEAPNRLRMEPLCDGPGSTISTMPEVSTRAEAHTWWAAKIKSEPGHDVTRMMPGGLIAPRVCGECRRTLEARTAA